MREEISIWFFGGVLFLTYGVIVFFEGLWELSHPLVNPPVLNSLHAPIWWGGLMAVAGLGYTVKFWPKRHKE
ncbi:MAG TPA: hypothetical protein VMB19_00800 [Silvibacterium sp.]|nr:hypothetical protein [Silvibacterium sp.]